MEAFEHTNEDLTVEVPVSMETYKAVKEGRLSGFSIPVASPSDHEGIAEQLTDTASPATNEPMTVESVRKFYEAMTQSGQELVDNQTGQSLQDMVPKKRVLALSEHGDAVWHACSYVLAWLIEYGDELLQAKAMHTRAYWESEQTWVVDWCNDHMYFHWLEMALKNPNTYRQALAMFPPEAGSVDESVRRLALMAAEDSMKPKGLKFKKIGISGGKMKLTCKKRVNNKKRRKGSQ